VTGGLRIAVVGGGLAGITAALECAEAGAAVTLYESRPRLGGATFSFQRHGYWLDNGQHVALRCCTAYRALLGRLGVSDKLDLQPRLDVPVLAPGGRQAALRRTALPAPLHLAASLVRYAHLSPAERVAATRATLRLRKLDPDDARLDGWTFGDWLRAQGQSSRAIEVLWNLITLPTLNLGANEASLQAAVFVFRTGLLDVSDACDLAIPRVPLRVLHGDPAERVLREKGVEVRLRALVRAVAQTDPGFAVRSEDAAEQYDRVVVAVPHQVAPSLLPLGVFGVEAAKELGASPIVNVHLVYDRQVLTTPFAAAVRSPLQWLFDRTASAGIAEGQLVSISLSAATAEIDRPRDELVRTATAALPEILPQARGAVLREAFVTREPRATFRAVPGVTPLRPEARTALPGLALAGAWTDTGWPATMEGAVRSGLAAAATVLALPRRRPVARRPAAEEAAA
jgi:squalene-associated FAD-dependent desaturase